MTNPIRKHDETMANEEVLGPRKTMFVLVIVVGCFAVLWPRILSPLILGSARDQLKPNQFDRDAALKQERPLTRGAGPHPALRERGRAIPAGAPTPPSRGPVPLPPHARVRTSPLSVYFELDIKPPPIPGMRPPLGSPGGPVPAPKSSMGFVMPIYTICIIVFFVYTLSKILFKRTGSSPYEPLTPDPQFRRRVFRDDSRSSPETKLVVTAISGLVAEVQQQMEASYVPNQQRQDVQDNHTRPYTNGTVLGNNAPVHIVTSEYREPSKEKSPEPQKDNEPSPPPKAPEEPTPEPEIPSAETAKSNEVEANHRDANIDLIRLTENVGVEKTGDSLAKTTEDFLNDAKDSREELQIISTQDLASNKREKRSTQELLEEALKEDSPTKDTDDDQENASVKVVNMEVTAHAADGGAMAPAQPPPAPAQPPQLPRPPHEAEDVKAIFLDTEIPQQSRVLVADFAEDRTQKKPTPTTDAPTVVSGKMTLSLIQDTPRDTPDRDLESTLDDFTTASAVTQPAAEKQEDLSEEEIEEEIEVEEIEEEIEEEEEEVPIKSEVVQKTEELKSDTESKQAEANQESVQIENEFNANEDAHETSKTEESKIKEEKDTEIETEGVQENENKDDEIEEQTKKEDKTEAVNTAPESKELSESETEDLEENDVAVKEEDGTESDQEEEINERVAKIDLKDATKPVVDDNDKKGTIDGEEKILSTTEGSKKDVKKNQVKTEESSEEEEEEEEEEE